MKHRQSWYKLPSLHDQRYISDEDDDNYLDPEEAFDGQKNGRISLNSMFLQIHVMADLLNGLFNTRRGTRDLYRDTIVNQLRRRYQTVAFERMRRSLDPNNILMNPTIEAIFADQETQIDHKSD